MPAPHRPSMLPSELDDGWEVASPGEVGLDAARLSRLDAFLRQWPRHNVHAVVIARRGRLVFERYFRGRERRWMTWSRAVQFSPTQKHDIRSISKSVTSLLVGMAVSEGKFPPIDSAVVDCFPEYADLRTPEKARITFRHLLTMSPGLRWDENLPSRANNELLLLAAKDPCRYVLEQPMALPPGSAFSYSGGATTLLAAALAKAVGTSLDTYASDKLFGPLGITDVEWLGFSASAQVAAFAGLRTRPQARPARCRPGALAGSAAPACAMDRRINASVPERRRIPGFVLWLPLVSRPFPVERPRPRLDRGLWRRRPTSVHRSRP